MLRDTLRTALVTGGARRIGRAIALALADQGWSVAIHYRTGGADAEALAQDLRGRGVRAAALGADLAREEETAGLVDRAVQALGPIACVIHNASTFRADRFETVTRASWDLHLEVNVRAPFVLTQKFAAQLPADEAGNVIHLLDQRVWNPTPFFVSYTLSKSALWALTRTLALALAPRIRVNAIGPGMTLKSSRQSEANFARQWASTPLGRGTTPAEIADAVRFILGAPSMTGQMIALDGGQHLSWGPSADLSQE